MKRELQLEFFKMRGRCWWLVMLFLLVQGAWMWWCMQRMSHQEIVQGWQHYLYNLPMMNAILLPVLMAVLASRSADMEHKGQMLRQLRTVESCAQLLLAKLFYGGWQIVCLLAGQLITMLFIGLYKGFYGPIPWDYFGYYLLFTFLTTLCIYLAQLLVSLLVRNQVISLILGLSGGFCGLFSLFFQQHILSKLVLWTYYSQLFLCGMNWDKQARITEMYWIAPNWSSFWLLMAGFSLTLLTGWKLLERKEC